LGRNGFRGVYWSFGVGVCNFVTMDSNVARDPCELDILIETVMCRNQVLNYSIIPLFV